MPIDLTSNTPGSIRQRINAVLTNATLAPAARSQQIAAILAPHRDEFIGATAGTNEGALYTLFPTHHGVIGNALTTLRTPPSPLSVPGSYTITPTQIQNEGYQYNIAPGSVAALDQFWNNARSANQGFVFNLTNGPALQASAANIAGSTGTVNEQAARLVQGLWRNTESEGMRTWTNQFTTQEMYAALLHSNATPGLRQAFVTEFANYVTNPANGLDSQYILNQTLALIQTTDPASDTVGLRQFAAELAIGIAAKKKADGGLPTNPPNTSRVVGAFNQPPFGGLVLVRYPSTTNPGTDEYRFVNNVPTTNPASLMRFNTGGMSTLPAPTLPAPTLPAPTLPAPTLPAPTLPAPFTGGFGSGPVTLPAASPTGGTFTINSTTGAITFTPTTPATTTPATTTPATTTPATTTPPAAIPTLLELNPTRSGRIPGLPANFSFSVQPLGGALSNPPGAPGSNIGGVTINADGTYTLAPGVTAGTQIQIQVPNPSGVGAPIIRTITITNPAVRTSRTPGVPAANIPIPAVPPGITASSFRVIQPNGTAGPATNTAIPPALAATATSNGVGMQNNGSIEIAGTVPLGSRVEVTLSNGDVVIVGIEPAVNVFTTAFGAPPATLNATSTSEAIPPGIPVTVRSTGAGARELGVLTPGGPFIDLGNGTRVRRLANGQLEFDVANQPDAARRVQTDFEFVTPGGTTRTIGVNPVPGATRVLNVPTTGAPNPTINLPPGLTIGSVGGTGVIGGVINVPGMPGVTVNPTTGVITGNIPFGNRSVVVTLSDGRTQTIEFRRPLSITAASAVATPESIATSLDLAGPPATTINQITFNGANTPVAGPGLVAIAGGGSSLQLRADGDIVTPDYTSNGTYTIRRSDGRTYTVNVNVPLTIAADTNLNLAAGMGLAPPAGVQSIRRLGVTPAATPTAVAAAGVTGLNNLTINRAGAIDLPPNNTANGQYEITLTDGRTIIVNVNRP